MLWDYLHNGLRLSMTVAPRCSTRTFNLQFEDKIRLLASRSVA
jgi:hypothetical protein